MKQSHIVKIKPSRVHAARRSAERYTPIPKEIDVLNIEGGHWNNARIDERGDVCIDLWLPYGTEGMYRGYPLAFKHRHFAIAKTAMHGREARRVERKMSDNIRDFPLLVNYLRL